jgi:hypothetical protein
VPEQRVNLLFIHPAMIPHCHSFLAVARGGDRLTFASVSVLGQDWAAIGPQHKRAGLVAVLSMSVDVPKISGGLGEAF